MPLLKVSTRSQPIRRRAGIDFRTAAQTVDVTDEQAAAIQADTELVCHSIDGSGNPKAEAELAAAVAEIGTLRGRVLDLEDQLEAAMKTLREHGLDPAAAVQEYPLAEDATKGDAGVQGSDDEPGDFGQGGVRGERVRSSRRSRG